MLFIKFTKVARRFIIQPGGQDVGHPTLEHYCCTSGLTTGLQRGKIYCSTSNVFLFTQEAKDLHSIHHTLWRLYCIVLVTLSLLTQRNAPTRFSWLEVGISEGVQYRGYDLVGCPVV